MTRLTTVQRAFEVIEMLWRLDGGGPAALADRLDLPKSTVHDYLQTLETTGYVVQQDGVYHLSYKFLATGTRLQHRNKLYNVTRQELKALAEDTDENANIGIVENKRWILLNSERGDRSLDLGTFPGLSTPLHTHAAAKALLAHLPESQREAVFADGFASVTEQTMTDPTALQSELETIRENGYAVDTDQQVKGMGVVAAPILADGTAVGSVAIVCPSGRLDDEPYYKELIRKVRESADTISVNYVYGDHSG